MYYLVQSCFLSAIETWKVCHPVGFKERSVSFAPLTHLAKNVDIFAREESCLKMAGNCEIEENCLMRKDKSVLFIIFIYYDDQERTLFLWKKVIESLANS